MTPVDGLVIECPRGGARRRADARPRRRAARRAARAARRRVRDGRRAHARAQPGDEPGLEHAGRRLRRLQTALRLWDDAEPALWARPPGRARTARRGWRSRSRPACGRATGDCLLAPEEEDPLRAFCSLVARRTPRAGELAWALRRFELGCERGTALEALTDWLLCARALLAEPDAIGYERLAERIAAICATPDERDELVAGLRRAIAMERAVIAGIVRPEPAVEELVDSLGACLRAILRDVLCGHLDPDLRRVADELLADVARRARLAAHAQLDRRRRRRAASSRPSAGRAATRCSRSTTADHGSPASSCGASSAASSRGTKPSSAPSAVATAIALASWTLPASRRSDERAPRRGGVGGERLGVVAGGAGDARDAQPAAASSGASRAR